MQFYSPESFIWLWSVPALFLIFMISNRIWNTNLLKLGSPATIQKKLMPHYRPSEKRIRFITLALVLVLAIVALARPQWGEQKRKIERKGVDVIFLLDTSLSMLAEDIKPNRFEKSKIEIRSILSRLKGDRIGMVAFAGSSFLQSPLTLDYSAFQLFIDAIKVGYIPDPGTSLDQAIRLAIKSFPEKETKHKAIVLFSDGEDNEGGIEAAIDEAKKAGLRVYTLGVGLPQGEPIPLRDEQGRKSGFKKDVSGQVVMTKLNQPLLEKIAAETGALYLPSTPGEQEIDILLKHMESLGKRQYKEKIITEREDHYQGFLLLAFLFLLLEMLVRKTDYFRKKNGVTAAVFILLFLGSTPLLFAADPVKLYGEKKYKSAMEVYRDAKLKNPDDPSIRYNLGTTLYQLDQFNEASQELGKTTETIKDPGLKAKALYNYGNAEYRLGNFEKAIAAYQKALELAPNDKDAKYNLEFLQQKKSLFDKKNQDRKNNKQNKDQKQNQQQKNQQQKNQQQNQRQQDQQQNQQQNQQQQNQDQKDQQQNPQQQGQQDQQSQDQKNQGEQQQPDQNKDQEKDQQSKPDEQQPDKGQPQPKPDEKQDPQDQSPQQRDQKPGGEQKKNEKPEQPDGDKPQPAKPEEGQNQQGRQPLQGQMTLENALQVLDALKEGEKEMQDLRRPTKPGGAEPKRPLKDW